MKCPIDQTEMEKGYLAGDYGVWMKDSGLTKRMDPFAMGVKVDAWKCSKCGKVELTTEVK